MAESVSGCVGWRRCVISSPINLGCSVDHLRAVVRVFSRLDLDRPVSDSFEKFRYPAIIFSRQYWETVSANFTVEETIVLAQALTLLERHFAWPTSCGAASIWILKDLWERQPKIAELLADWIERRTRNGYIRLACDHRPHIRQVAGDFEKQSSPCFPLSGGALDELAGLA